MAETSDQHPPRKRRLRVATAEQYLWVMMIVKTTLVLNLLDAVATIFWVSSGMAVEGNPFLQIQAQNHPVAFASAKIALVSLGTALLWRERRRPMAVVGIFIAFLVYYYILLFHLSAMNVRLVERIQDLVGG